MVGNLNIRTRVLRALVDAVTTLTSGVDDLAISCALVPIVFSIAT
jgi:hypothetical protein